jgi:hypothetical protein
LAPVWLVAGASATAALTLVVSLLQGSTITTAAFSEQTKLIPPAAVVWGSRIFVVLIALLALRTFLRLLTSQTR